MTETLSVAFRPGVFADAERIPRILAARLRKRFAAYVTYRRTLSELRALSIRQREDLGFVGLDLTAIARSATRNA